MKLVCEFGAQKCGVQADSSSLPARGDVDFPSLAPDTSLSLALLSLPFPAGNALLRTDWVLLCSSAEQEQVCGRAWRLQSCWSRKRGKERLCRER